MLNYPIHPNKRFFRGHFWDSQHITLQLFLLKSSPEKFQLVWFSPQHIQKKDIFSALYKLDNQLQKCWDTLCQKRLYLLPLFANCKFVTEEHLAPLSPFQCCSPKFFTSYCIASNIGKGGEGRKIARNSAVRSFLSLR